MVSINGLSLNLISPTTIVSQRTSNHADIVLRHGDGLSVVKGLDSSKRIEVLLNEIGELVQQLATVLWRDLGPGGLEGGAGRGNGFVDILLGSLGDVADFLLVGWVDDFDDLLLYTLNPLVVDETVVKQLGWS